MRFDWVRAMANALEVRLDVVPTWRGGELERVVNARHTALHQACASMLARFPRWLSVPEASFSICGERGIIDRLAFHAATGMLAVLELKADLSDPAGLLAQTDRYRRLAMVVAHERGIEAAALSCWVLVADSSTNRRRLAEHRTLLRGAFPADGRQLPAWLRDPAQPVNGLAFLSYPPSLTSKRPLTAAKRVRRARRAPLSARNPVGISPNACLR